MGRIPIKVLLFLILLCLTWLAGERYGAPQWLTGVTDQGFSFIERNVAKLLDRTPASDSSQELAGKAETADQEVDPDPGTSTRTDSDGIAANRNLRINEAGLQIIKDNEGLELEAYSVGTKTYIGYGHQLQPGDPRTITAAEAERLLRTDLAFYESGVRARLTRPATQNQFSAMVSLAYTMGLSAFDRSPVLARFNGGDIDGAAEAFLGHNRAGGKVVDYLAARRERERALFMTK